MRTIVLAVTLLMAVSTAWARQNAGPRPAAGNVKALIAETSATSDNPRKMEYVWWIPVEFWRLSMANDPSVTREQIEAVVGVLSAYTLVAVADGDIGPLGGVNWTSEEALRASVVVLDSDDHEYRPVPDDQIRGDAKNLLLILKPLLAGLLGPMGENLRFFYFPARTRAGTALVDPAAAGRFAVRIGNADFRWRLPLGSLIPQKACPVDGERMSGAWTFCPWHGKELTSTK